jgi:hypothetical protein
MAAKVGRIYRFTLNLADRLGLGGECRHRQENLDFHRNPFFRFMRRSTFPVDTVRATLVAPPRWKTPAPLAPSLRGMRSQGNKALDPGEVCAKVF